MPSRFSHVAPRSLILILSPMALLVGGSAQSLDGPGQAVDPNQTKAKDFIMDFSVPDSSGLFAIGVRSTDVQRPTSPKMLATALATGLDENGNLQTGLAIDFNAYMMTFGNTLTIEEYRTSWLQRAFARSSVSIGTAKGVTDSDKAFRVAVGLNMTPFDAGDPRTDEKFMDCMVVAVRKNQKANRLVAERELPLKEEVNEVELALELGQDSKGKVLSDLDKARLSVELVRLNAELQRIKDNVNMILNNKEAVAQFDACKAVRLHGATRWNASSWALAVAPVFTSKTGNVQDLDTVGVGAWTTAAWGFEQVKGLDRHAQILGHVRYSYDDQVATPMSPTGFVAQDNLFVGGRLRVGAQRFNLSLEGGWVRSETAGQPVDSYARYKTAVDIKVTGNLWFNFSLGSESGNSTGNNSSAIGTIKYAFGEKPTLTFE